MTIFEYIDKYGNITFEENRINEVDKVIFSFISYVNLQKINPNKKMTIQEINRKIENSSSKNSKNIIAERDARKILKAISKKNRYKDCLIYNYKYESDNNYQFSAITIEYLKNEIYISFEGTDEKIGSWYEDFLLSYMPETKSHLKAVKYLRKYTLSNKKIILGGHSKGGNIALVAAMNTNILVNSKIKEIYSMDGPGVLPKVIESRKYKKIENKYYHIIPDNSLVGILLESTKNIVIKSNISGILSHDIIYWDINETSFVRTKMSYISKTLKNDLNKYIYSLSKEQLQKIAEDFEKICKNIGINSIIEIVEKSNNIIKLLKESAKLNKESRELLIKLLEIFVKALRKSVSIKFFDRINKLKEKILD